MHHAAVVELAERGEQHGEKQHPAHTADLPAHINRREGAERVQPDLIPQELGLQAVAHQIHPRPAQHERQSPAAPAQQQAARRPGQQVI